MTLKHNQGHWKWYDWVKLNKYYHHAEREIHYSVRENRNIKVFATYGLASPIVILILIITYSHFSCESKMSESLTATKMPAKGHESDTLEPDSHTYTPTWSVSLSHNTLAVDWLLKAHEITYQICTSCVYLKNDKDMDLTGQSTGNWYVSPKNTLIKTCVNGKSQRHPPPPSPQQKALVSSFWSHDVPICSIIGGKNHSGNNAQSVMWTAASMARLIFFTIFC